MAEPNQCQHSSEKVSSFTSPPHSVVGPASPTSLERMLHLQLSILYGHLLRACRMQGSISLALPSILHLASIWIQNGNPVRSYSSSLLYSLPETAKSYPALPVTLPHLFTSASVGMCKYSMLYRGRPRKAKPDTGRKSSRHFLSLVCRCGRTLHAEETMRR
jgi:hypothetical protein